MPSGAFHFPKKEDMNDKSRLRVFCNNQVKDPPFVSKFGHKAVEIPPVSVATTGRKTPVLVPPF